MKKNLFFAAILSAALLTSCEKAGQNGASEGELEGGASQTTLSIQIGNTTKSTGAQSKDNQTAYFDDTQNVTIKTYATADLSGNPVESFTTKLTKGAAGSTSVGSGTTQNYEAKFTLLKKDSKFVDMELNGDGAVLGASVNSRQGSITDSSNPVVLINGKSATALGVTNNGQVVQGTGDAAQTATASLTVAPEMARIEIINDLATDAAWNTFMAKTNAVNGGDFGTTMTYAQTLKHYQNLQVMTVYADNVKNERTATAVTNQNAVQNNDPLKWLDQYKAGAAWVNLSDDINFSITGVAGATTLTNLQGIFGSTTANVGNAVGYNIFPTSAPEGTGDAQVTDAKDNKHPHMIIAVKYQKAVNVDNSAGYPPVTADGYGAEEVKYINLAAYLDGASKLVTFNPASVYQVKLSDVLNFLLKLETVTPGGGGIDPVDPPTTDPDAKDTELTVAVQVLNWDVVPVTPLPL